MKSDAYERKGSRLWSFSAKSFSENSTALGTAGAPASTTTCCAARATGGGGAETLFVPPPQATTLTPAPTTTRKTAVLGLIWCLLQVGPAPRWRAAPRCQAEHRWGARPPQ